MEITSENAEKVLREHGLGMDAGLNRDWLAYGYEPGMEKRELTLEEAFALKPANIRIAVVEEPKPPDPGRVLNLHDMTDQELRQRIAVLYGGLSFKSYVDFCEKRNYPRMNFEQWTLIQKQLTATAPDSTKPKRKKDRTVSYV